MPPLFTSRPQLQSNGPKHFSRVTSFKREWDDDDDKKNDKTDELEWSPSPERTKAKMSGAALPTSPSNPHETAADRRRKAILAAMSENTPPVGSSSSSASSSKLPPKSSTPSFIPPSNLLKSRPLQELPSLLDTKKRPLPWEEDVGDTKKARERTTSTKSSSKRTNSNNSTGHTISIKQKLVLSSEQQKVLKLVVDEGKNMFFTGSAGTGKSVLLREIIKSLRKKYALAHDAVAVTASTGIAACNIGGVTLHSFGGVGLANEKPEILVGKLKKNKKAAARWQRTRVLIIDEVSMVDGELFDKFCKIGQLIRKAPGKPWGGIQIIVTGDFFQLPPVTKNDAQPKFAFEASTWDETIHMSVNLTKVFRQKDPRFVDMLNEMRFGQLSKDSITAFGSLSRPIKYDDEIEPTELFPRREDVDRSNNQRLDALNTSGWTYQATDGGALQDPSQRSKLLQNFMAPHTITLKIDAQVMLIKNMDETLVNGSMGKVVGFCHKTLYYTDSTGAWLEDGPDLDQFDAKEREKQEKIRDLFLSKLPPGSKPLPVVQFKVPGGGRRDLLVEQDSFKTELPNGEVQVSRTQLPLILAWAMSIHKSQGQTLDRVKVDLGKVFEKGQAYVALSRATSLEGLQVLGFKADKVMVHRKVATWTKTLKDLNE